MNEIDTIFQTAGNHLRFARQHTFAKNHAQADHQLRTMSQYINALKELVRVEADKENIVYARFEYDGDEEVYTMFVDAGDAFHRVGQAKSVEELAILIDKTGYHLGGQPTPFALANSSHRRELYRNIYRKPESDA